MSLDNEYSDEDLVCVAPRWGRQIWRLQEADLDPDLGRELQEHLVICDACRQSDAVNRALAGAVRSGRVNIVPAPVTRQRPWLAAGGVALLAASLALVFVLPPRGRPAAGLRRGLGEEDGFIRPVEGEVVRDGAPRLAWRRIAGASEYRVEVSEVGGAYHWSTVTADLSARPAAAGSLPPRGVFRALVQPVPADLTGPVDVSVIFRRAGWREYLAYRFGAASPWLWPVAAGGLLALLLAVRRPRTGRDHGQVRC